jgi:hypothetical protein
MAATANKTRPRAAATSLGSARLVVDEAGNYHDLTPQEARELSDELARAAGETQVLSSSYLAAIRSRSADGGLRVHPPELVRGGAGTGRALWRVRVTGDSAGAEALFSERGEFLSASTSGHSWNRETYGLFLGALSDGLAGAAPAPR